MCASYGLQITADQFFDHFPFDRGPAPHDVARWLTEHSDETVKPTGRIEKRLNPIVTADADGLRPGLGWWGYLVGGMPAKWPSINTRIERVIESPSSANGRALVPATEWFEFEKPSRQRWSFHLPPAGDQQRPLLAIAALTRPGRPTEGEPVTCYSLLMQPARADLAGIHDRMPLLVPLDFADEWLAGGEPATPELLGAAVAAGAAVTDAVVAEPAPAGSGRP